MEEAQGTMVGTKKAQEIPSCKHISRVFASFGRHNLSQGHITIPRNTPAEVQMGSTDTSSRTISSSPMQMVSIIASMFQKQLTAPVRELLLADKWE
jgi:hypothetical protein